MVIQVKKNKETGGIELRYRDYQASAMGVPRIVVITKRQARSLAKVLIAATN
jgi:hypothetical protein